MKLLTGMRIGQSQGELMAAVLFSSIFHVIVITAALLIAYTVRARIHVPPFYSVKLVDLPRELSDLPPVMTPPERPPLPKAPEKQQPRVKAPAPKAAPRTRPDAMPELKQERKKPAPAEEAPRPKEEAPARPQEAVTVAVAGEPRDRPFPPYYVAIVRDKVERNWNPPPGAKGAAVRVLFSILRSGRVDSDIRLLASSGNFYFDQAAMRAILASSPFPPLPEGFFRDQETFSVDLMERE